MRKTGYILLFVGIVIEASSLAAVFTTNQPFHITYGLPMLIVGWRLTRYGKGIHATKRTSEVDSATSKSSAGNDCPSREMPVTSAVADLFSRQLHHVQKMTKRIAKILAGVGIVAGSVVGASVGSSDGKTLFFMISMIGVTAAAVILFVSSFHEKRLRRDLSETTYLRARGPIEIVNIRYGNLLRLSDRAILLDNKPAKAIKGLDWATVDYSRHAKLILAVWDRAGKPVYQFVAS